ncbi:MAG: nucleotidyltransferase domain-containing protein [Gammaproteobacteria bacterium]
MTTSQIKRNKPIDDELRLILKRHPYIGLSILLGSLTKGTARSDSDLDLAVDAGRPLTQQEKECLIEKQAAAIGKPVDLIDLFIAGEPPLLGQIVTGGRKIKGSDEKSGALIYKHLIEQADFLPLRRRILEERRKAWIGR